jgi:hypothetical protein
MGDSTYPKNGPVWSFPSRSFMSDAYAINVDTYNNFIWSPQATTTVMRDNNDFTNGYGVPIAGTSATLTNNLPVHTFTSNNGGNPSEDVTPPTVSITAPAAGSSYNVGQSVTVRADAYDVNGISRVEFSDGGDIYPDTIAPYELIKLIDQYTPPGQHAWFATAYDTAGNHTTSGPLYFTVNSALSASASIFVSYPTAGSSIYRAASSTVSWTSNGISGNVKIDLHKNGVYYKTISASAANTGRYPWTPNQIVASTVTGTSNTFQIVISGTNTTGGAVSGTSGSFYITAQQAVVDSEWGMVAGASTVAPTIQSISPVSGAAGTQVTIAGQNLPASGISLSFLKLFPSSQYGWGKIISNLGSSNGTSITFAIPADVNFCSGNTAATGCDNSYSVATESGTYTISSFDSTIQGTVSFTVPPTMSVLYPSAGATILRAAPSAIYWKASGIDGNVKIDLWKNGVFYKTLAPSISYWDTYSWVPNQVVASTVTGTSNKFQIVITGSSSSGYIATGKSGEFYIIAGSADPLKLTAPNTGETWLLGTTHTIKWTPYDPQTGLNIASQVSAYLEKLVDGKYVRIGKVVECGKASIHWDGSLDTCGGKTAEAGQYYIYLINNFTGQWDRSDKAFNFVPKDYFKADLKINGSDGPIEVLSDGVPHTLSWTSTADTCSIYNFTVSYPHINYSRENLPGSGSISLPLSTSNYVTSVFLKCESPTKVEGSSSDKVEITPSMVFRLTAPNNGETWLLQNTHTVKWSPYDPVLGVNPAADVSAYLERLENGQYVRVGKIVECGKASIHWDGSLDVCGGKMVAPGAYYINLQNNVTGKSDRSDKPFQIVPFDYFKADLKVNGSDGPMQVPQDGGIYAISWTSTADTCTIYNDTVPYYNADYSRTGLPGSGSISLKLYPNNDWYSRGVSLSCSAPTKADGSSFDRVEISPKSSITVVAPNGGEQLDASRSQVIQWNTPSQLDKISIGLYKNDASYVWIKRDLPVSTSGSFPWTPSDFITTSDIGNNIFKIYVLGYLAGGGTVEDKSDAPFSIVKTGSGELKISAGVQPAATLAPEGALVPFTKIKFTAIGDDINVGTLTVERTGLMNDAAIKQVALIDAQGHRLASAPLNDRHQAVLPQAFAVLEGNSIEYTIAADMATNLDSYAGQVGFLSLVGVGASYTASGELVAVTGTLPITGAGQTVNSTLSIGSLNLEIVPNIAPILIPGQLKQTLGAFTVSVANEPVSAQYMTFRIVTSENTANIDLTNIVLTDAAGTVLAGPMYVSSQNFLIPFTNQIIFPRGNTTLYVKGDVSVNVRQGAMYRVEAQPAQWIIVRGQLYGYGITPTPNAWIASNPASVLTFTIPPSITINTPLQGETIYAGSKYHISWKPVGIFSSYSIYYVSSSTPEDTSNIATGISGAQQFYDWPIVSANPGNHMISVCGASICATKSVTVVQPSITVTAPTLNSALLVNTPTTVSWKSVAIGNSVSIKLMKKSGTSYSFYKDIRTSNANINSPLQNSISWTPSATVAPIDVGSTFRLQLDAQSLGNTLIRAVGKDFTVVPQLLTFSPNAYMPGNTFESGLVAGASIEKGVSDLKVSRTDLGVYQSDQALALPMPGSVTLEWSAPGADNCMIDGTDFGFLPASGEKQSSLVTETTELTLRCANSFDNYIPDTILLAVNPLVQ